MNAGACKKGMNISPILSNGDKKINPNTMAETAPDAPKLL